MLHIDDGERLAAAFGLGGPVSLVGPVDRGELGQVWRLRVGANSYAIKETFDDLDDHAIATAHGLSERVAGAGVSVPQQLRTVDGELVVRDLGAPLRCYAWLDLEPADRELDAVAVGDAVAVLHRVGGPTDEEVDPFYTAPVGGWDELVSSVAHAPFAEDLARQHGDLVAAEAIMVTPVSGLRLGHRDLFADNVRRSGDHLVVIDWDNAGPVHPAHELAFVLAEFATTPARAAALVGAYAAAGGPAELTGPADFTMVIAVLHHLLELDLRRWLAAEDDRSRERAAARVAMFTDDPFGLREIDRLLEWTAGPARRSARRS